MVIYDNNFAMMIPNISVFYILEVNYMYIYISKDPFIFSIVLWKTFKLCLLLDQLKQILTASTTG